MIPTLARSPFSPVTVALAVVSGVFAPAMADDEVSLDDLRGVFLRDGTFGDRIDQDVVAELAELGAGVVPHLFVLFAGGESLDGFYRVEGVPPQEVRWWGNPDQYGRIAAEALVERMPGATTDFLRSVATDANSTLDERLGVLHLTARLTSPAAFELWLEAAGPLMSGDVIGNLTRVTVRKSLAAHLDADGAGLAALGKLDLGTLPPTLRDEISRALELAPDPRGLDLLVRLLEAALAGQAGPPAEDLLPRIDTLARRFPWVLGESWLQRLFLLAEDERLSVRLAALDAMRGRSGSYDFLLEQLLRSEEPDVVRVAGRSLATSFATGPGMGRADWENRVTAELLWWQDVGREQAFKLAESTPDAAARLMRSLACRSAFHADVAAIVAEALPAMEPDVARGLLALLAELRQPSAVPFLVETLHRGDPELEPELAQTLERLTGLRGGSDSAVWREALAL